MPLFSLLRASGVLLTVSTAANAQLPDSAGAARRVGEVVAMMNGVAVQYDTMFAPAFLNQLPGPQLQAGVRQIVAQVGNVESAVYSRTVAGGVFIYNLATAKGFAMPMNIHVAPGSPNLIDGMFIGNPVKSGETFDDLAKDVARLPGHASFFAARLDGGTVTPIAGIDTARALAIGSAFKLYVLSQLVREIEAGKRHWNDVVVLDSSFRSLPSGMMQSWPPGSPVTVQTLAQLMISISDNTAADQLLHLLGRENVEDVQSIAGDTHASMNVPFLSTREMFALKSPAGAALLRRYLNGNPAARRAVLDDVAHMPQATVMPNFSNGPVVPDSVEWFASTADLGRTMTWLRDQSATGPAKTIRDILTVNKGAQFDESKWHYVGFKGGSEPGVLALNYLLQRNDGKWFVLSAVWNDRDRPVDQNAFLNLLSRGVAVLARTP